MKDCEDIQFIDRKFAIEEIARIYGVPIRILKEQLEELKKKI